MTKEKYKKMCHNDQRNYYRDYRYNKVNYMGHPVTSNDISKILFKEFPDTFYDRYTAPETALFLVKYRLDIFTTQLEYLNNIKSNITNENIEKIKELLLLADKRGGILNQRLEIYSFITYNDNISINSSVEEFDNNDDIGVMACDYIESGLAYIYGKAVYEYFRLPRFMWEKLNTVSIIKELIDHLCERLTNMKNMYNKIAECIIVAFSLNADKTTIQYKLFKRREAVLQRKVDLIYKNENVCDAARIYK